MRAYKSRSMKIAFSMLTTASTAFAQTPSPYRVELIEPESPAPLEPIHATVVVNGCGGIGSIKLADSTFRIEHIDGGCFSLESATFTLGAVPAGQYGVELGSYGANGDWFVQDRKELVIGEDSSHAPIGLDLSGLWWDPAEPGWGIEIFTYNSAESAGFFDSLSAIWYTYDAGSRAEWFLFTGKSEFAREYRGTVYRSTGAPFAQGDITNGANLVEVGTGIVRVLNSQRLEIEWAIDGRDVNEQIERFRYR